jgi:hypothetical protein
MYATLIYLQHVYVSPKVLVHTHYICYMLLYYILLIIKLA